jgi:hypothetical protein
MESAEQIVIISYWLATFSAMEGYDRTALPLLNSIKVEYENSPSSFRIESVRSEFTASRRCRQFHMPFIDIAMALSDLLDR